MSIKVTLVSSIKIDDILSTRDDLLLSIIDKILKHPDNFFGLEEINSIIEKFDVGTKSLAWKILFTILQKSKNAFKKSEPKSTHIFEQILQGLNKLNFNKEDFDNTDYMRILYFINKYPGYEHEFILENKFIEQIMLFFPSFYLPEKWILLFNILSKVKNTHLPALTPVLLSSRPMVSFQDLLHIHNYILCANTTPNLWVFYNELVLIRSTETTTIDFNLLAYDGIMKVSDMNRNFNSRNAKSAIYLIYMLSDQCWPAKWTKFVDILEKLEIIDFEIPQHNVSYYDIYQITLHLKTNSKLWGFVAELLNKRRIIQVDERIVPNWMKNTLVLEMYDLCVHSNDIKSILCAVEILSILCESGTCTNIEPFSDAVLKKIEDVIFIHDKSLIKKLNLFTNMIKSA